MRQAIRVVAKAGLRVLDWKTKQRVLEAAASLRRSGRRNGAGGYADYSVGSVDASPKHADPAKLIDRLFRYERALGEEIDFAGKTVLEIGAGPVLGWALVGIARGAACYHVLEPAFNPAVLDRYAAYFRTHRQWIGRVVGEVPPVDELLASGAIRVVRAPAARTGLPEGSVDLVLSNSVLEHVEHVDALVDELDRICGPDALQYHVVDFTDHQGGADPFAHVYGHDPEELRALYRRRGMPINLLRLPELTERLARRFEVEATVLLEDASHPSVRSPEDYWRERFTKEELGIEVAVLKLARRHAG
ncbi:MAG: methyltransferase domain-containing protein [Chloroflexi bacterium]|nr:methyltransferase domain-containing protein [Chloroflexota bacterium]